MCVWAFPNGENRSFRLLHSALCFFFNLFFFRHFQIKNLAAATSIPSICECKEGFETYFERIDRLQVVIETVNNDLTSLEQRISKAEEDLGYNNTGLKGFLKPFFTKAAKTDRPADSDGHEAPSPFAPTFKASDFFGEARDQN